MRVLVTIPHYVRPGHSTPVERARTLAAAVERIRAAVLRRHSFWDVSNAEWGGGLAISAGEDRSVDVVVVTRPDGNALHLAEAPAAHVSVEFWSGDALHLGYRCHDVLRSAAGAYDWYCFLEDDIALIGDDFFERLAFYSARLDDCGHVLMPNRYERDERRFAGKVYIDHYHVPDRVRNLVRVEAHGRPGWLEVAANPHAGCFFLTTEQMARWSADERIFRCRTSAPLEDAATFRLAQCFTIWKPACETPWLLEVEHLAPRYQIPEAVQPVSFKALHRNLPRHVVPPPDGGDAGAAPPARYAVHPVRLEDSGTAGGGPFLLAERFPEPVAPASVDAWRHLLSTLYSRGAHEECLAHAFRLLRHERLAAFRRFDVGGAGTGRRAAAFAYEFAGRVLCAGGDAGTGTAFLQLALANAPDGTEARALLEQVPETAGTGWAPAEACQAYLRLAAEREGAGRLHVAAAYAHVAGHVVPDSPDAFLSLARLLLRTGDFFDALWAADGAAERGAPRDAVGAVRGEAAAGLAPRPWER